MADNVIDSTRIPVGFESLADVSAATGLNVPENARVALVQALDADCQWRDDGTDPVVDPGGGFLLAASDSFLYVGDLHAIKFIEAVAAATSRVNVVYYK